MSHPKHNKFSIKAIKGALLDRDWSVKELARRVAHPRPTVSSAINGNTKFPRVRAKVMEVLGL